MSGQRKTRGKQINKDLSSRIVEQVAIQACDQLKVQLQDLLQNPQILITSVLEKKVEINWYQVAQNTNTVRRQCYKHFHETIAPKITGNGFTEQDEVFILEQMHRAIEDSKPLDMRLLDDKIKPIIGKKYLKVALLRKFNNLKRTKEILNHLKEVEERQPKRQVHHTSNKPTPSIQTKREKNLLSVSTCNNIISDLMNMVPTQQLSQDDFQTYPDMFEHRQQIEDHKTGLSIGEPHRINSAINFPCTTEFNMDAD